MYSPLGERFEPFLRTSGKRVVTMDLYYAGDIVKLNLAVASGSVTADATSDVRRSAHVTVIPEKDDTGVLLNLLDVIFGYEAVIKAGVQYANGEQELIPQGRFMIWNAELNYNEGNVVDLELYDRAKYLDQYNIVRVYDASGMTAQAVIQALVDQAMPIATTVIFDPSLPNMVLPGGTTYDSSALQAIMDICEMIGAEFYFDLFGVPQCKPKKSISSATSPSLSVFTADAGENGVLVSVGRHNSRENIFNGIGVYGATPDDSSEQVTGEAYDMNSASRTYWNGPFGKAFKRIDRPELLTDADCQAAAQAELDRSISAAISTSFDMLPNPALEPGDYITVIYPDGVTELHLIDSLDFDMEAQSMSVTTRGSDT